MLKRNPYIWAGLSLLIAGVLISLTAHFILQLTWLTAMGICMLILSFILLALGRTIPKLSPEVAGLLLETGINNMGAIVEELGIKTKAIYLPSPLTSGRPQALVPLHSNPSLPLINKALPDRFITRYGIGPDDVGLLFSTVGSAAVSMLESKPGPNSSELEAALTSLFVGILGIADSTNVTYNENRISVEIHHPRIENNNTWSEHCLGGPLASVAAAVAAEAWNKPVMIEQEEYLKGRCSVQLEVMG